MNFQIHIHKEFKGHFGDGYFALMMDLPVVRKYISSEYCSLLSNKHECAISSGQSYLLLFIIIYYYLLFFIIIYYYLLLFIIIYYSFFIYLQLIYFLFIYLKKIKTIIANK